jgi:hypothetical protein
MNVQSSAIIIAHKLAIINEQTVLKRLESANGRKCFGRFTAGRGRKVGYSQNLKRFRPSGGTGRGIFRGPSGGGAGFLPEI